MNKGSVWAFCDDIEHRHWGIGPEGAVQALRNCNWYFTQGNGKDECQSGCPDITSLAIIGDYFGTPITNSLPISFRLTAHITSWNSYLVLSQDTPSTLATRNFAAALIIRSGYFMWNDIKDGTWGAETEHIPFSIQLNSAFTIEGTLYSTHIS